MVIYKKENAFDAALKRIEMVFNEFERVIVSVSGGKDSTVLMELCIMVARKLGRLPINVMWMDQEAEWQATEDYLVEVFKRTDELKAFWYQVPFWLVNSSSYNDEWLDCWEPSKEDVWIRPQHPMSIHKSPLTEKQTSGKRAVQFYKVIARLQDHVVNSEHYATLTGMRSLESLHRKNMVDRLFDNRIHDLSKWDIESLKTEERDIGATINAMLEVTAQNYDVTMESIQMRGSGGLKSRSPTGAPMSGRLLAAIKCSGCGEVFYMDKTAIKRLS